MAEELWQLRTYAVWMKEHLEQAPNLPDNNVSDCLGVLTPIGNVLTRELDGLVRDSFIVSKQPNVVLKQHNKFNAETRLLIGEKLGIRFLNLKVGVKLIRWRLKAFYYFKFFSKTNEIFSEENARALKDGSLNVQNA